jgi:outer membrane protein assembly factor BamB/predicted phosphodiesterase
MIKVRCFFSITLLLLSFAIGNNLFAQAFKFAHVTDTHIGNATGEADLINTILDINQNKEIDFVVVSGDITEFGSDDELRLAKEVLNNLNKPWYVIPGNHDTNWSESGANSFKTIFGYNKFHFAHKGFQFIGIGSGPNMRMGPGQIPREDIVWLDSTLNTLKNTRQPIIYINHYPQDSSLNNWYSAIDLLKQHNVQLMLCGHGHVNRLYQSEGIPNVMGRSNLRAKESVGGYNIVTIQGNSAVYEEKTPLTNQLKNWLTVVLKDHQFDKESIKYPRPSFKVNGLYPNVKEFWTFQDNSDLGVGISVYKNLGITANTNGEVYALNLKTGKIKWTFKTNGKVYSTPAVNNEFVIVGSSDHYIYCLSVKTGALKWKFKTDKAVLGSPLITKGMAYIGGSDHHFRAFDMASGKLIWDYSTVKGFVVTKPLLYQNKIYFGSWGNEFYALDAQTGKEVWKWSNGATNRMFSPAACYPVVANGKVFIVAPDRYMTALDAENGSQVWRATIPTNRVRESIGISEDKSMVYAKTMDGKVFGVSTSSKDFEIIWNSSLALPYEISPTAISTAKDLVFIPSNSGLASALDKDNGDVIWQYKTSNTLINTLQPYQKNKVLVSTMDGKITCLKYKSTNYKK